MVISFGFGINLYNKMPLWMQSLFGTILAPIPTKFRGHGAVFRELGRISQGDFSKLRENQEKALRKLVVHAYQNTEFFKNTFDGLGLDPSTFGVSELHLLPILTKEEVRGKGSELRAENYRSFSPGSVRTSGSTGEPLEFLIDQRTRVCEYASEWRCISSNGARIGGKTATFRGNHYRENRGAGAHWFRHALSNELNFNTYSMTPETCEKYVEKLIIFDPQIVRGFPSSLATLSSSIKEGPIFPDSVVFCSSEMMDDSTRGIIESRLSPNVVNWYSQSEYVVSAGECPQGKMHINSEFGILEVVDEDGEILPDGQVGRLIGTSLTNFSQPFIRYELDDLGSISNERCPCGLPHLILESVAGRTGDEIIIPDGRRLSTVQMQHWWKHHAVEKWNLDVFDWIQIVQTGVESVTFRVVLKSGEKVEKHRMNLIAAISDIWGYEIPIEIEEFLVAPHGQKWRFSISEIT